MTAGFVHLRCRSQFSLLEGATPISRIAAVCAARGMPACALTDSDNLFGALEFSEALAKAGVQPIIGVTLHVRGASPVEDGARASDGPDGTLALLARSEAGYRRLMALSSRAFLDSDGRGPPTTALADVLAEPEGLLALTGGPDGVVERLLAGGREDAAAAVLDQLCAAFGDALYVELQRDGPPGPDAPPPAAEAFLLDAAAARGLGAVASNEPYFETPDMHAAHDALLCIKESAYLSMVDRRKVSPARWFTDAEEMARRFPDRPEALANTLDAARRCAYRPRTRGPILPRATADPSRDEAAELRDQAEAGLAARLEGAELAAPRETYQERLDYELGIINQMGFPGYFLIVADFIKWAKREGIPVGPGRGSGAGSLVAWALTITDLDPLRFNLVFERFLNPERVSMPDFDIDFCQDRREEVIRYVADKYGADRTAQIITFGSLQARAVLRDVGRVMQLPFGMVDRLAKLVPANPANPVTLAQAIETEPRLQAERDGDADVAKLLETAQRLEGLLRNASTHAAGVVIGDRPLTELVPLYRDPRAPLPATQFNMNWVEPAGLVKFDFLGLKTLTVLTRGMGFLDAAGEAVDLDDVPLDDPDTYAMLARGDTVGVFQFESSGMRDLLRRAKPSHIEDLIALVALYRPGPMENIPKYLACKHGEEQPEPLHPSLAPIVDDTYGVIIYQEQVMQIAQVLAGYSLGEADLLRRAMGKKKKEEMDRQRERFVAGAGENGIDKAQADRIFDVLARFAGYGFNKAHSAAYAYIAYQTAYLKANHPVAFIAASMSLDITNTDKLAAFVQEARRMGVPVRPVDVNASEADFTVEADAVRYAMGAVRTVGRAGAVQIAQARASGGPFKDLGDFAARLDPGLTNKRSVENLARAGGFDAMGLSRSQVFAAAGDVVAAAGSAADDRAAGQASLFGEGPAPLSAPETPAWEPQDRLDEERAAVGFYLTGHPLDDAAPALRRRGLAFSADLAGLVADGRSNVRAAGVVRARQERVSAKSGERFAFVSFSDPTGEFEAYVPPEHLVRWRDALAPGAALAIGLRLADRDGELRISVEGVEPMDSALRGAFGGMRIVLTDAGGLPAVKARLEALSERSGADMGLVTVAAPMAGGGHAEVTLPGALPVDARARAAVRSQAGVARVEEA